MEILKQIYGPEKRKTFLRWKHFTSFFRENPKNNRIFLEISISKMNNFLSESDRYIIIASLLLLFLFLFKFYAESDAYLRDYGPDLFL